MKYLLCMALFLFSCATTPKYKVGDCVDFTVRNVKTNLEPSEFREIMYEFQVVNTHKDSYIVNFYYHDQAIPENYELKMSTVDSNESFMRCEK